MTIVNQWLTGGWPSGQPGNCGKWNNGDGAYYAVAMDVGRNAARREARRHSRRMARREYARNIIICRNIGNPSPDLPERAQKWIRKHGKEASAQVLKDSRKAIKRIQSSSELSRYWDSHEGGAEWKDIITDLRDRLKK